MDDPHIWWYVTRASAILAWALMTLSTLWGVLLATRVLRKVDDAGKLQDLHRYLGGLGLVMAALHVVSLMLDGWLQFTPLEALVPLQTDYRPWPVALGILALYLVVAGYLSGLLRNRIPRAVWKGIHFANYAAVLLIAFHAGLTGTDVGSWWYLSVAVVLLGLTVLAIVLRLVLASAPARPASAASPASPGAASAPSPSPAPADAGTAPPAGGSPRPAASGRAGGLAVRAMTVVAATDAAAGVRAVRLAAPDGSELPPWDPGAHIAVRVPGVGPRQYSLCGDPADRGHYDIAVLRDPESRGGSAWMHTGLRPGATVEVEEPRNHFRLAAAPSYLFIAGGIGITPLRAMLESLPERRDWRLWYLGRSRESMAFLPELLAEHPGRIAVHARDEHPDRADVARVVASFDGEVYCCGPQSPTDAVGAAGRPGRVHVEHFAPVAHPARAARPLRVEARRTGVEVDVPADGTMLDALEAAGVPVVASCRRGVCGSCELGVLEGRPEHLDSVLSPEEADEYRIVFPCVSRSLDDRLVLDV